LRSPSITNDAAWAACIAGPATVAGTIVDDSTHLVDDRQDPVELFARRREPHLVDLHQHLVRISSKGAAASCRLLRSTCKLTGKSQRGAARPPSATRSRRLRPPQLTAFIPTLEEL
jgi:hypothetical protein